METERNDVVYVTKGLIRFPVLAKGRLAYPPHDQEKLRAQALENPPASLAAPCGISLPGAGVAQICRMSGLFEQSWGFQGQASHREKGQER